MSKTNTVAGSDGLSVGALTAGHNLSQPFDADLPWSPELYALARPFIGGIVRGFGQKWIRINGFRDIEDYVSDVVTHVIPRVRGRNGHLAAVAAGFAPSEYFGCSEFCADVRSTASYHLRTLLRDEHPPVLPVSARRSKSLPEPSVRQYVRVDTFGSLATVHPDEGGPKEFDVVDSAAPDVLAVISRADEASGARVAVVEALRTLNADDRQIIEATKAWHAEHETRYGLNEVLLDLRKVARGGGPEENSAGVRKARQVASERFADTVIAQNATPLRLFLEGTATSSLCGLTPTDVAALRIFLARVGHEPRRALEDRIWKAIDGGNFANERWSCRGATRGALQLAMEMLCATYQEDQGWPFWCAPAA